MCLSRHDRSFISIIDDGVLDEMIDGRRGDRLPAEPLTTAHPSVTSSLW